MGNAKQPTYGNGKICYVEIPAIDVHASAEFYGKVFGWHIRKRGDGSVSFDDTVGEVSGTWVQGRKPGNDASVLLHIMVDRMDITLKLIVTHGGKITQPVGKDLPEITARFSDPAGNIFGLYQQPE